MTQDEIIRMAREAEQYANMFCENIGDTDQNHWFDAYNERFAALVAAHEREKQADQEPVAWMDLHKELGQLRWAGKDIGWDLAIDAVRNRLEELYAAPVRTKDPCHPWQDLTDDEMEKAFCIGGCRAVIAADREKNKCQ